ncbi:hypothetical protein JCM33374_g3847 [Metschnikowia sp. JCM 33374]|nr:hypothetical protein JCM33374_g3847 [Metschnikowia sp. JCM 33374]
MVSLWSLASLGQIVLSNVGGAPPKANSPTNVLYTATFNHTISGAVSFFSENGSAIVDVNITNLPESGGPFMYHVHEKPVPSNGDCLATLGHFNPYNGSMSAPSAASKEVGDLSGKHGLINGTSVHTRYIDPFLSLNPNDDAYFGHLSVVVHYKNSTRIACANITRETSVVPGDFEDDVAARWSVAGTAWFKSVWGFLGIFVSSTPQE